MTHPGKARTALKRGALLVAANWQLAAIQSVADTTFKMLVAVPILGGALLATLLLEQDAGEILAGDLRETLLGVAETLAAHPLALAAYLSGFLIVVAGGAVLMFLVKGGTVSVLVEADRLAGPIEQPPLRMAGFRRGMRFSIEGFTRGASRLFRRYLGLGLLLTSVYTLAAALCVLLAYGLFRLGAGDRPVLVGSVAALAFALFIALSTIVNVFYLLAQIALAVRDCGVGRALAEVPRFVRGQTWKVMRVFLVTVLLLVLATALSIAAAWGFYLIAYVPLASIIVLPLQLGAWLLRSLLFQYLGLTALGAYLSLYRSFAGDRHAQGPTRASR
ncbi:MAG: hypothetical protein H6Q10_259 [Acidobacteria bacterium]|nr:hypothetical protein [Acidobacteriota bacterium]